MSALQLVEDQAAVVPLAVVKSARGTTNRNARGNVTDRQRRRRWLVETYRADVDVVELSWADGTTSRYYPTTRELAATWAATEPDGLITGVELVPACRCYRCGCLLTEDDVTVDRIIPGCKGGTYRRNNIRPACGKHNSETGGQLGAQRRAAKRGRS